MKLKNTLTLIAILAILTLSKATVFAQDEEEKKVDPNELKGQVEGIDENVNALLVDVAGLKKIKISGYLQINFEKTESASGFAMSPYDSSDMVQGRFRVRRSRVKFNYDGGLTQVVVQGDFSNAGFELKDAYLSFTDPWTKYFTLTTGVFNRPNYEVEYSSSQRESMERSLVVRTLYPGERDLGAMLTFEHEDLFKLQFAGFNNTYTGTYKQNNPNYNDEALYYMARITKEFMFPDLGLGLDIGAHARFGNLPANTYKVIQSENNSTVVDSTTYAKGDAIGRNWFGFEAQVYFDFLGGMKLMGEYIMGTNVDQPTTADKKASNLRLRDFSGFYVMLVKNLGVDFQIAAKYDSYNPNTAIAAENINNKNDLAVSTIGFGLHNYSFSNVRISLWYDMISTTTHETVLPEDPIDNLLTLRFQYKF